jgi:hypothetical protein
MNPSNSFMDRSVIDRILPILIVFITAFRAIIQRRKLQALVPAMPEECTSPMFTLQTSALLPRISASGSVPSLVDAVTC